MGQKYITSPKQPSFPKTRRGQYAGDKATDPLEKQAWPKGTRYMGKRASLPERRVIWWLLNRTDLQQGVDWEFQSDYLGGRVVRGGLVSDFALYTIFVGEIVLWEVLGTTWHAWTKVKDEARKGILLNIKNIAAVIDLKEEDIIHSDRSRDDVCEAAMRVEEWG
jgi:hypothetical protein